MLTRSCANHQVFDFDDDDASAFASGSTLARNALGGGAPTSVRVCVLLLFITLNVLCARVDTLFFCTNRQLFAFEKAGDPSRAGPSQAVAAKMVSLMALVLVVWCVLTRSCANHQVFHLLLLLLCLCS